MKIRPTIILSAFIFILCGCITDFNASGIDEVADILVVEGIITDDESTVMLSRSVNLNEEYFGDYYIDNAHVYVACDDGTQWEADSSLNGTPRNGRYTIHTGLLNPDRKYRLKIEIEEVDSTGFRQTYEYCSDYSYSIKTPEIDSIFWIKRGQGQQVTVHVSTHEPEGKVLFYRWSYTEDWEINSQYYVEGYPYYCWNRASSRDLLIGSAEKTVFGKLIDIVTELSPSDRKLSVLYRITVKQNAISKRAYNYFANIKKNVEQTGSIFTPVPSELRGNITCTTDPDRPVIGYIDVSSTTQKHCYIMRRDVYEVPYSLRQECEEVLMDSLLTWYNGEIPDDYVLLYPESISPDDPILYARDQCVDCRRHGTEQKPDDWPDNH